MLPVCYPGVSFATASRITKGSAGNFGVRLTTLLLSRASASIVLNVADVPIARRISLALQFSNKNLAFEFSTESVSIDFYCIGPNAFAFIDVAEN